MTDGSGAPVRYLEGSEHRQGVIVGEPVHERGPGPMSQGKQLVLVGLQNRHTQTQHIQDLKGKRACLQRTVKAWNQIPVIKSPLKKNKAYTLMSQINIHEFLTTCQALVRYTGWEAHRDKVHMFKIHVSLSSWGAYGQLGKDPRS